MTATTTIFVLSNGEEWGLEGEVRWSTAEDVDRWEEDGVELGDVIAVVGDSMEVSGDLWTIEVTEEEMDDLNGGLYPRKFDDYYDRCEWVGWEMVVITKKTKKHTT